MVSVFYELHVIIAHCSLIILPRQQKGTAFGRDVAPLGRKVGATGFARGASPLDKKMKESIDWI